MASKDYATNKQLALLKNGKFNATTSRGDLTVVACKK